METSRTINVILSELSLDAVKHEDALEKAINENVDVSTKLLKVKHHLKELVINEAMITRFQSLVQPLIQPNPETGNTAQK